MKAVERLVHSLGDAERRDLEKKVGPLLNRRFVPLPGQQALAYESEADVLLYGGSAGGGKSAVLVGLAATRQKRSLIVRREASELDGLIAEGKAIFDNKGWNGQDKEFSFDSNCSLKLGGMKEAEDWRKYAGRARDFMGFDEAAEFLEIQVASIMAWNRSADKQQRCRVIFATNPPRSDEGEWVDRWFAPWLDDGFSNPALAGELRWALRLTEGEEIKMEWVEGPGVYIRDGEEYEALSYTFIPANLDDNPFLSETGYRRQLQNLPGVLRDQLLKGDFKAGRADHEWQLFPSAWLKAAQERWKEDGARGLMMTSVGADVAQGGDDVSSLAPRYGGWYAPLQRKPGSETPDTETMAAFIFMHLRNGAGAVVDIGGGYGVGPAIYLRDNGVSVKLFDGSKPSQKLAKGSKTGFFNKRAEVHWRFREALDPSQDGGSPIALPPDPRLIADLSAVRYELAPRGFKIEDKKAIKKRIGRSPDDGDAVVMGWSEGQAMAIQKERGMTGGKLPKVIRGYAAMKRRR
jgi:hypothetical protein